MIRLTSFDDIVGKEILDTKTFYKCGDTYQVLYFYDSYIIFGGWFDNITEITDLITNTQHKDLIDQVESNFPINGIRFCGFILNNIPTNCLYCSYDLKSKMYTVLHGDWSFYKENSIWYYEDGEEIETIEMVLENMEDMSIAQAFELITQEARKVIK